MSSKYELPKLIDPGASLSKKRELIIPSSITELRQLRTRGEFLVRRVLSALNMHYQHRTEETAEQICVALALRELCEKIDSETTPDPGREEADIRIYSKADKHSKHACCADARDFIHYLIADSFNGPDETGWCVGPVGIHGDCYVNIKSCPFCGSRLEATTNDNTD